MTQQPRRVTPGEISELLDAARQLSPATGLDDLITYHERKASLLSRVAADLDTTDAHQVAADAWHYVSVLAARRDQDTSAEVMAP